MAKTTPSPKPPRKPRGTLSLLTSPRDLWRFVTDKNAPKLPRLMTLLAVLYVVFPVDLVPDAVPILGWLDDIGFTAMVLTWLASAAARYQNNNPTIKVTPVEDPR